MTETTPQSLPPNKNHPSMPADDPMNPPWWHLAIVLALSILLVHGFYEGVIRPQADSIMAAMGSAGTTALVVILKDAEQQICITLMLFGLIIMARKFWVLSGEEAIYNRDILAEHHNQQTGFDVESSLQYLSRSRFNSNPAVVTWINCLRRYLHTQNVQHAADAIESSIDAMAAQLEAGNNLLRYIIWAIPSFGFVGTVRGIGSALAQADAALLGDISGMTNALGVAFNSTLVALVISLIMMFFMHLLNNRQDAMVLRTQAACENYLLTHLR